MKQQQSGFTLVELMVAMTIGLLVVAGATQLLISSQQSYRFQTALANMQDNGRFALDTLTRELRQTAYYGACAPSQTTVHLHNTADSGTPSLALKAWRDIDSSALASTLLNPVADQDSLMFRGAPFARTGFVSQSLQIDSVDNSQQLTLNRGLDTLFSNQLVLLQGLQSCDIFYNTSDGARTLQKGPTAGWQSNLAGNVSPWGKVSGLSYSAGQNVSLSALNSAFYYIGQDPENDNAPSLMRLDLSQTTPRNEVLASHVAAMRTTFLVDQAYLTADEISDAQWAEVSALRISLIVQSDQANVRPEPTTISAGNFRGDNVFNADTGRLYQAFTTTIALRNR